MKKAEEEGHLTEPEIDKSKKKTSKESDRDRFDNFTERAVKVLSLAQEEAQRFQHNYIGTEHLLLGLVREGEGVAAKVLSNLGVELNKVRIAVEFIIGRGDRIVQGEIGLTPRAKQVIELAVDEARRLNHHYIGTEHLLLGLVREGEGIAAGVLESLGTNLENVRTQTLQVLSQPERDVRRSKTPIINQMGVDLTDDAFMGKLNPIIGRHQEIERVTRILCRRNKNNPVLIGGPGVGKTAIVKGLAQRLVGNEVPTIIAGKRLLTLDLGVLPGIITKWRDEAGQQLQKIIEEVRTGNGCILVLDDLPRLFGANATERMLDAAQLFKLALSRGELQCLGTSTPEAYESMIKQDVALQAWFEKVQVGVMTIEETVAVLQDVREEYEWHYRLVINDEALKTAAELANQYISDLSLPGKAIALLDEAASQVSVQNSLVPPFLKEAVKGLESVLREKKIAIQQQEYELVAELRDREVKLRNRIIKLESGWRGGKKPIVDEEAVAQIVSAGL